MKVECLLEAPGLVVMAMAAFSVLQTPSYHLLPLLPERYPDPEPANHLDKGKSEHDTVLEPVTTPTGGGVSLVRHMGGRRVRKVVRTVGAGKGRRGTEDDRVEDETEREEKSERR